MDPSQKDIDQFWEIYPSLPSNIQKAIFSEETAKAISFLISEYNLEEQPTSKLANIVGDVLLGLKKLHQVPELLRQEYPLTEEESEKLTVDLDESIFKGLRGGLKELNYKRPTPPSELKDIYGEPVE